LKPTSPNGLFEVNLARKYHGAFLPAHSLLGYVVKNLIQNPYPYSSKTAGRSSNLSSLLKGLSAPVAASTTPAPDE
jgi:hypothetical protein